MLFLIAGIGLACVAYAQTTVQLNDSQMWSASIASGDLQHYYFDAAAQRSLGLQESEAKRVYLTLTSCSQPIAPGNYEGEVPSLNMFISTSSEETTLPGPSHGTMVNDTNLGRISWNSGDQVQNVWIGVVAPTLTDNWSGNWTYQIAISTQGWMHPILSDNDGGSTIFNLEDTDDTHALFTASGEHQKDNRSLLVASSVAPELRYSLCAVDRAAISDYTVNTTRTPDGEHFLVSNLTSNSSYMAYLIESTGSLRSMSAPIHIQTKADDNCRLIYGLGFCDQVAYSVPAKASDTTDSIRERYDDQARQLFEPFNIAISQFNCETTQYSLVRNCTDCYQDYKRWLCAVSIPRCTSISQTIADTVAVRVVDANGSRNPWIDEALEPGTWTELLPCIDLCYQVVQSCPPFMAFNCPKGDLASLQYGYWKRSSIDANGMSVQLGPSYPTLSYSSFFRLYFYKPEIYVYYKHSSINHRMIVTVYA
ncbi:calcium channel subunit mid1 [Lichtheimia corymbifera JMRC:FSU:9682]|uniref:Calcium channel subunit mid1 n=1 Tax=Lichtheimia corymbifera JMRC:FSU:9682 TaxID=1263082 RepID=A0A068SBJ1_9FUNG|nr:calcium channel subunit mid1 [Lichtheimia corymbifera JMRC:FSU:9682]